MEHILGLMAEFIQESGRITRWKDRATSNGLMADFIEENIAKIRRRVLVSFPGQMVEPMREIGKMGNSMEKEYLLHQKGHSREVFGRKEDAFDGFMSLTN